MFVAAVSGKRQASERELQMKLPYSSGCTLKALPGCTIPHDFLSSSFTLKSIPQNSNLGCFVKKRAVAS